MKPLVLYYAKCSTCRKALKWLEENSQRHMKNHSDNTQFAGTSADKLAALDHLIGLAESDAPLDKDEIHKKRLARQ